MSLARWQEPIKSRVSVGLAGMALVTVTVAAGLGLCAVLGLAFNATTTQIVPFLALGLGLDNMFLLTHTYTSQANSDLQFEVSERFGHEQLIMLEVTNIVLEHVDLFSKTLLDFVSIFCIFYTF